ncbi:EAL domain-containing protein [Citrobacter freundii]|nr:EAL domain-containing protein [Citrobacter freundii]MBC6506692.1 EAL domain-containing protein [Citrobacter freundii]
MSNVRPDTLEILMRDGVLIPCFQPLVNMQTLTCCGAEILTRFHHPTDGILTPASFISPHTPEAQLSGLTQLLMSRVSQKLTTFCFPPHFMLTFNIVPDTLSRPWLLPACQMLLAKKVSVTLELTEQRPLTGDMMQLRRAISRLQDAGVRLAIDDFGTGYAGLSMLMNSGGDYIKIPREFIAASADNPRAEGVIGNILHLAATMNMTVIAEGVESRAQVEQLMAMGISLFQGACFSMPLCFSDFILYLRNSPQTVGPDTACRGSGRALSRSLLYHCARLHRLSPRETEVLVSTAQGEDVTLNAPSGESRSPKTFSAHKRNAYRKIGVKNDVGLIHYLYWLNENCRREGLLTARMRDIRPVPGAHPDRVPVPETGSSGG